MEEKDLQTLCLMCHFYISGYHSSIDSENVTLVEYGKEGDKSCMEAQLYNIDEEKITSKKNLGMESIHHGNLCGHE